MANQAGQVLRMARPAAYWARRAALHRRRDQPVWGTLARLYLFWPPLRASTCVGKTVPRRGWARKT